MCLCLGDGSGGFGSATRFTVGAFPASVAVADFNGDGKPDLATANSSSNNVSVLLGDGNSARVALMFSVAAGPASVAVGDFNGDGKPDLATANGVPNNVSVLRNIRPPAVGTSPGSVDFGSQAAGSASSPRSVMIINTGEAPLHITGATITGPDSDIFIESTNGCTSAVLQGGESCAVHARFWPGEPGGRSRR